MLKLKISYTAWKVSKYGVISGQYFPVFSPNTGKYGPEITPYLDTFHPVLLSTAKGELFEEHIFLICDFYVDDLNKNGSETQLPLLGTLFEDLKTNTEVRFIIKRLRKLIQSQKLSCVWHKNIQHKLTQPQKVLFPVVTVLVKLTVVCSKRKCC